MGNVYLSFGGALQPFVLYHNHQEELYKRRQTSFVTEYQGRFEQLSNQVYGSNGDISLIASFLG